MDTKKRVVVNTLAQNIRSVLNVILSLYSTRIVLELLGDDYGLYSLVAGVIAMLAFVTNAMVISTQRYLSFLFGKNDSEGVRKVFANSLLLQIVFASVVVLVFFLLESVLFTYILKIPADRAHVATQVYHLMLGTLFFTFLVSPYRALFIARENIVYISVIDVVDGILKLGLVFTLYWVTFDRLVAYACIMLFIMVFCYLAFLVYSLWKFPESCFLPRFKDCDFSVLKGMGNFAGWTVYSTACIVGRAQGMQVVLNQFFSLAINKAYGIAIQVSGAIQFVAVSILNAMTPQIVKAEGHGDRERMLSLSITASKFAFLLLALVVVPLVFEMPNVLQLWLGQVPEYADTFARLLLLSSLCDQLTVGLGTANQAIGRIRNYSLVINTTKLITLPLAWLLFHYGFSIEVVMTGYLLIEVLCMLMRLPFLHYTAGLSVTDFLYRVFLRVSLPLCAMMVGCLAVSGMEPSFWRLVLSALSCVTVSLPVIWFLGLEESERQNLLEMVLHRRSVEKEIGAL